MFRFIKKYKNPYIRRIKKTILHLLLWKSGCYKEEARLAEKPKNFKYPTPDKNFNAAEPSVTWINHATFLISIQGLHFLTDPIFGERCSPVKHVGPKRNHPPGIELCDLPKIDFVLVSHNHYDHLEKKSVLFLNKKYPDIKWIVPKGLKGWFSRRKIYNVYEMNWWDHASFFSETEEEVIVTSVPTQHFSGRGAFDFNRTLWCGFVVEKKCKTVPLKRFYFVGDTGYNEVNFKEIGKRWDRMDLSLIPIGTYLPSAFMKPVHISPYEAVKIHKEVNSSLSVGMHWKTFRLSEEPLDRPPYDLFLAMQKEKIPHCQFLPLDPGYQINW